MREAPRVPANKSQAGLIFNYVRKVMAKYSESAMGYRRQLPGIHSIKAEGFSQMIEVDAEIEVPRDSTSFVGRAGGTGDLVLVNGNNTGGRILGYLDAGKFESDKNIANLRKLENYDSFTLKVGEIYPLWNNPGCQYRIQIAATAAATASVQEDGDAETNPNAELLALRKAQQEAIDKLKVGATYDLVVNDGVQQLDGSKAGTQMLFIEDAGGGYVVVEIAPAVSK